MEAFGLGPFEPSAREFTDRSRRRAPSLQATVCMHHLRFMYCRVYLHLCEKNLLEPAKYADFDDVKGTYGTLYGMSASHNLINVSSHWLKTGHMVHL